MDQLGDQAAHGLDAERQRRDVEQQLILNVAGENAGLNGGAEGDHFIGIQFGVRPRAEQLLDCGADQRDAGGAADHHDFIDLLDADAGIWMQARQGASVRSTMGWMRRSKRRASISR